MEKVLTIAVPSYNTQDEIDRCLPTMLQHPDTARLEILLVNDGSTDHTLEKMRWYERHYPGIVTVINKKNGGHGSAVNAAILKARGTYFKVIDGDDRVLSVNLGKMIRQLAHCRADMVIHPYIKYHVRKKSGRVVRYDITKNDVVSFDKAAERLKEVEIHAATYRTSLLRKNRIRVRENCFYEDTEYNIFPIRFVNTVCAFNDPVYVYHIGTDTQSIHPKQAFRNRKMHSRVIGDCITYYEKYETELSQVKKDYIRHIITRRIRSQYMIYIKNQKSKAVMQELWQWDQALKERSAFFYKDSNSFPVCMLRRRMHGAYPLVRMLYLLYAGVRETGLTEIVPDGLSEWLVKGERHECKS
uniref:Glycosyltransferase 2-like domain-containing protein n=1 Tax=Eubacterium plexicaudatum ASF492 TaxID=1235802 RepID=N2BS00_9FIRM